VDEISPKTLLKKDKRQYNAGNPLSRSFRGGQIGG